METWLTAPSPWEISKPKVKISPAHVTLSFLPFENLDSASARKKRIESSDTGFEITDLSSSLYSLSDTYSIMNESCSTCTRKEPSRKVSSKIFLAVLVSKVYFIRFQIHLNWQWNDYLLKRDSKFYSNFFFQTWKFRLSIRNIPGQEHRYFSK